MARLYIVESVDGEWSITRSTPMREFLHIVPRVKDPGVITLGRFVYVVDPHRFRRIPYKPKRWLKLATDYHQVQLWRQGDPEPKDLFDAPKRPDDITGGVMAQVAKMKKIKELTFPGTDWKDIVVILCLVVIAVLGIAIFTLVSGKGGA